MNHPAEILAIDDEIGVRVARMLNKSEEAK